MLAEHLAHPLLLTTVREHRDAGTEVALLLQFAADLEQVVLGVIDEDQPARADARDLTAQLAADRAARSGDEHDLAGEVGADPLQLHADLLAPEDVLQAHLAQLTGDLEAAAGVLQQLKDGRQRPNRDATRATGGDDAGAQLAGRRRDRDRDLVGLDLVQHTGEVGSPPSSRARAARTRP